MKRVLFAATLLSLAFALPSLAAESNAPPPVQSKKPVLSFEERKTQILKRLEERSARLQREKVCVQAAQNEEDLKACRQKTGPPPGLSLKGPPGASSSSGASGPPGASSPPGASAVPGASGPPGATSPSGGSGPPGIPSTAPPQTQ